MSNTTTPQSTFLLRPLQINLQQPDHTHYRTTIAHYHFPPSLPTNTPLIPPDTFLKATLMLTLFPIPTRPNTHPHPSTPLTNYNLTTTLYLPIPTSLRHSEYRD